MFKRTKIACTIGPSSADGAVLEDMVKAGMNCARLNFSHGTFETHAVVIEKIRAIEKKTGEPLAILQDLQGPHIRIGPMPDEGVNVKPGDIVVFATDISAYTGAAIPVGHPDLHNFLKPGERMLVDDGRMEMKIKSVQGPKITTEVVEGGTIKSHKGLNFPDSVLAIPALSEKDKNDLRFGVKMGVDMVGLSFVSSADDILETRKLINQYAREEKINLAAPIFIVAKIERHEAVENLAEIIDAADGIMVARGDLGLELPKEEVPLIQKRIIDAANAVAKPVIVATQLLDSMQHSRRPTRAEVSDVANAVIDHADALLLTNETASGDFPVLTVQTMSEIIMATEESAYDDIPAPVARAKGASLEVALSEMSRILADQVDAKVILAASITGETGRLISRVRPELPIVVATENETTLRQLNISWGVKPFILLPCKSIEELVERSVAHIKDHKFAKKGDKMIIVAGEPVGTAGNVNLVEVREIK